MELLNMQGDKANERDADKSVVVATALRHLSTALCRGNAVIYKRSLAVLDRWSGKKFRGGLLVPSGQIQ